MTMNKLKRLPLHDLHIQNSAKMTNFAGWEMPVSYGSSVDEHMRVRKELGFFDVSHMGELFVHGSQALEFLNCVVTNDVKKISGGQAIYTLMCNENGGVIDDLIIYRISSSEFFLCVNASNTQRDFLHLKELIGTFDCCVEDVSSKYCLIAVQGPNAEGFLNKTFKQQFSKINRMQFCKMNFFGCETFVARTGYTGEDGFEIFLPLEISEKFARDLTLHSTGHSLWVGLAARDSLRLEAGYCLHGHEITEEISPIEARLIWAVSFNKNDFVGKSSLEKQLNSKDYGQVFHYQVRDRRIPREGTKIICEDDFAGTILSGGYSPLIKAPIGTVYIEKEFLGFKKTGNWYAEVRGKMIPIHFSQPVIKKG